MKRRTYIESRPVSYEDAGTGEPCVLVHGAGANRNYWKALTHDLAGAHTIVPDLYGHGDTPAWRPSPTQDRSYAYADDVELLARITNDIPAPLYLVGHSSGGAVCLEFARLHPDRVAKLVVAEPMLPTLLAARFAAAHTEVRDAYESAHTAVARGEFETAARTLFEYILGDGEWDRLADGTRTWMTQNVELTLAAHSRASLGLEMTPDRYGGVRCSVLLIHGERTRAPFRLVCEALADSLPDARLTVVDAASHNAPITHAQHVNAQIVRFLALPPAGGPR